MIWFLSGARESCLNFGYHVIRSRLSIQSKDYLKKRKYRSLKKDFRHFFSHIKDVGASCSENRVQTS